MRMSPVERVPGAGLPFLALPSLPKRIIEVFNLCRPLILGSVEGGLQREIKLDRNPFSKRDSETG